MSKLIQVFTESFKLLFKHPKLFVPKIIMVFVHGFLMLLTASLVLTGIDAVNTQNIQKALEILTASLILLALSFSVFILDTLIAAMYSVLVKDYYQKKPIKLVQALKSSNRKAFTVVPAVIIYTLIFIVLTLPLSFAISFFLISGNFLFVFFSFSALIVLIYFSDLLFFLIYPVSVYEKVRPFSAVKRTVNLSRKNLKDISKASAVPFSISLVSWALAFLQDIQEFLIVFIVLRFLVAVVSTYSQVLDPVFYLKYEKIQI